MMQKRTTWKLVKIGTPKMIDVIILKIRPMWFYRKNPKISDTRKFAVITLKVERDGFSLV